MRIFYIFKINLIIFFFFSSFTADHWVTVQIIASKLKKNDSSIDSSALKKQAKDESDRLNSR